MAWPILIVSGVMEAIWATALAESNGFRRRWPTVAFLVFLPLSMAGLAFAMLSIPVGTAYAVWVGIGAVLTAVFAVLRKAEVLTATRAVLLVGLIGCVIGLKVVG